MSQKTKPLTEGGQTGFNAKGGSIRPSIIQYTQGLRTLLLNKELAEYTSRFKWEGLPNGISGKLIETMLYYKGQLMFFKIADKYYILPYAPIGDINHLGIQTKGLPLSYSGVIEDNTNKKHTPFSTERNIMFYDAYEDEDFFDEQADAVVLKSHSSLNFNQVIPTVALTDELRSKLVENLVLIRNNLILSQPVKYVQVENASRAKSMRQETDNLIYDILNGNVIQTIVGQLRFENVNSEAPKIAQQDMWQSYASGDNLRMESLGILNNGVFEKRERNLTDEVAGKQTVSKLILQDAWDWRRVFCTLINKYFNLNVKVTLSEMNTPVADKEEPDKRDGQFNPNVEVND